MIYISKLSMKNFKSFKRATLPIKQGFTAIVGPNGSGKSNIIDAICFVLGRSSAKSLRAERFADLIFNGGKKEKPAKEAEVTIYFDNAGRELPINSREVRITRSIDISGNSVYRINGKRSSRAEILELLAEAKVYPDGHNIISQGDVTKIIEMSPIERRQIIDEIAGISEYDEKKRKATRELEKVSENVSRVNAVLREVGEQLERLRKEREDALRYRYLKEEIKKSKAMLLHSKHRELNQKLEKIEEKLKEHEERRNKLERLRNILNIKLEVKKKEVEKLNQEIILKEETEQFSVFRELEKSGNALNLLEDELSRNGLAFKEIEKNMEKTKEEMRLNYKEIKNLESKNTHLSALRERIKSRILSLKKEIDENYSKISKEGSVALKYREELKKLRKDLNEVHKDIIDLEKAVAILSGKREENKRIKEKLEEEIIEIKNNLDNIIKSIEEDEKRKNKLEKIDKDIYIKRISIEEKISEVKENIRKISTLIQLNREEEGKLRAECKFLEKRRFDRAIEEILKLKKPGVYGTIAELGVTEKKYAKALEIAAGAAMNFIVVEDDKIAEECIEYLKKNKIGRATFLPLKNLKFKEPKPEIKKIASSTHGFAIDLIGFDSKFKPAFYEVFRDTVVIENIEEARRIGIGKCRMVTLDGDLIEKSGKMSGGHFEPKVKFDIDESRKKLMKIEREIEKLARERENLIEIEVKLEEDLKKLNKEDAENKKELETLSERIKLNKKRKDDIEKELVNKELYIKELSREIRKISSELNNKNKKLVELRRVFAKLDGRKKELEEKLQGSEVEELLEEIRQKENKLFKLEKEKDEINNKIKLNNSKINEILKPRTKKLKDELISMHKEKKIIKSKINDLKDEIEERRKEVNALQEKSNEIQKIINELKSKRNSFLTGIKKMERKIGEFKNEINRLSKSIEKLRVEIVRVETKLEEVSKNLEKYRDVEVNFEEKLDLKALEDKVLKMEFELNSLEPINMRAIQDFEEVKKKYEGIKSKVDKLEEERQSILELMDEIEHRKKEVFMKVFENIARNFRRIFSKLSDGGEAELVLDERNPLEGGLQIKAKPPGKNPQYIELMSGGEKTLTALSFIFAIQRYQPVPFYVMDEIDMFLDDANVKKVSELIKESSKEAQFIVVSLRQSLMSSADHLFGVINEDGVSKIIGVELEEIGS